MLLSGGKANLEVALKQLSVTGNKTNMFFFWQRNKQCQFTSDVVWSVKVLFHFKERTERSCPRVIRASSQLQASAYRSWADEGGSVTLHITHTALSTNTVSETQLYISTLTVTSVWWAESEQPLDIKTFNFLCFMSLSVWAFPSGLEDESQEEGQDI